MRRLLATALLAGATITSLHAQVANLDRRILRRSSIDPNVLVSDINLSAWYIAGFPLAGRTLADIDSLCAAVQTKGGGPWRAPTIDELATLTYKLAPGQYDPTRLFYDTPDRRFFGKLIGSGGVRFRATDFKPYVNGLKEVRTLVVFANGYLGFKTDFARTKQEVILSQGDRLVCVGDYPPIP